MPLREYIGKPIDMTYQYITERPEKGETVGGTTKDDYGEQQTEIIPSFINTDELTDQEQTILRAAFTNPKLTGVKLAEQTGISQPVISRTCKGIRNKYEKQLKKHGLYRAVSFPQSYERDDSQDDTEEQTQTIPSFVDKNKLTDAQQQVIEQRLLYPDTEQQELAEISGVGKSYISITCKKFRDQYEDELREHDLYDIFLFSGSKISSSESTTVDDKKEIKEYLQDNPDASVSEVKKQVDTELSNSHIGAIKGGVVAHLDKQSNTDEPIVEEELTDEDREIDYTRIEQPENKITENSPDGVTVTLPRELLFNIIVTDAIDKNDRKVIFNSIFKN